MCLSRFVIYIIMYYLYYYGVRQPQFQNSRRCEKHRDAHLNMYGCAITAVCEQTLQLCGGMHEIPAQLLSGVTQHAKVVT